MPSFIRHRVNTMQGLDAVDPHYGVEIDLRSQVDKPGALHLCHDPWQLGENFAEWLERFVARGLRGPLILNTKEDGLEERALELVRARGISSFFFLDTALPTLIKWVRRGLGAHFAARLSRFEPAAALLPLYETGEPGPGWLWVDCFNGEPIAGAQVQLLAARSKVCLVSPELQQQPLAPRLDQFAELYPLADAICTKEPGAWQERYGGVPT